MFERDKEARVRKKKVSENQRKNLSDKVLPEHKQGHFDDSSVAVLPVLRRDGCNSDSTFHSQS